ncbi:serine hydrolase [Steroidobacter sp.]|uniref:serine hydrolase n=1 Tax=Steroidobacter sp. TaxID=1978227 RepID=UPI001A5C7F32|nr:serine hydrolase [Steroidobacter sp.]MBL8270614.1 serine hydrolase [Steroidobacter sp.]
MKKPSSWWVAAYLLFIGLQVQAADATRALQGVDGDVRAAMKALNVPGAAVGVIQDGKVLLAKGYGVLDVNGTQAVDADTIFAIGSVSKSFTTAVMATLVDEGKLDWDRPVHEYLPWFRMYDPVASELITPRDMVSHRSGMPRYDFIRFSTYLDRRELVRRIQYLPPNKTFRDVYQYNNLMFVTAGYLSGELAGSTWEGLVQQRIFQPLGMSRSNTSVQDSMRQTNHALPHTLTNGKLATTEFYDYQRFGVGPNGAVNSSVNDMLKYLDMYLHDGRAGDRQVISAAQVKELTKPVVVAGPDEQYALAWSIEQRHEQRMVSHGGSITGFTAHAILLPEKKIGIVVLNNLGSALPGKVGLQIADRLLGKPDKKFIASLNAPRESRQRESEPKPVAGTKPTLDLQAYTGNWFHPAFGTVAVQLVEGHLAVKFDAMTLELKHFNYDTFQVERLGGLVKFRLDAAGKPAELLMPLEVSAADVVFVR